MKIETLAQAVMPAVKPAVTAAAGSWRQALELAQWQGRQRYQALPVMPSPALAAAAPTAAVPALPQQLPPSQAAEARTPQVPHEDTQGSTSASRPAHGVQAAAMNVWVVAAPAAAPGPASPLPRTPLVWRAPTPASYAPPPQAASQANPLASPWPAFASHVSLSGNQVSAALRDASLDPQQAQALRRALVKQLGANGWQLAELRINGIALDN